MIPRIAKVQAGPKFTLCVDFDDGKSVVYDVSEDIREVPSFSELATLPGLFENFQLDSSRTCVFWNDRIDLPSDSIYEFGKDTRPKT